MMMNDSSSSSLTERPWNTMCNVVRWLLTGFALVGAVFVSMPPAHAAVPGGSHIEQHALAAEADTSAR